MTNKNIQMKKREGNDWDNLYPVSLNENIYNTDGVNLNNQLDDINSSLIQTEKIVGINIENFPRTTTETDDTGRIQRAIDYVAGKGGGILKFTFKNYVASTISMKSNVWLESYGATLTFKNGSIGNFLHFLDVENVRVRGFTIDGLDRSVYADDSVLGNRTGLYLENSRRIVIEECLVKGFNRNGMYLTQLGSRNNSYFAKAVKIREVDFETNYFGLNFDTRAEYCQVNGVSAYLNRIGIKISSGNVHVVGSFFNRNVDGIHVLAGNNDSHGSFTGCTSNHNTNYALFVDGISTGETFNGCHFYDGSIYIKDSLGVQITDSHIGGGSNIYLEGGDWNSITNNFFHLSPTFHRGYNGKPDKTEVKGNRRPNGSSNFDEDTATVFLSLTSMSGIGTTLTGRTTLKYTGTARYTLRQTDGTLYDSNTGRGRFPYRRTYSISYIMKVTNMDTTNSQRVLVGIQTFDKNGTTVLNNTAYKYVTIPPGGMNHVISGSWVGLKEQDQQFEIFIAPTSSAGIQLSSATETRLDVTSLD